MPLPGVVRKRREHSLVRQIAATLIFSQHWTLVGSSSSFSQNTALSSAELYAIAEVVAFLLDRKYLTYQ